MQQYIVLYPTTEARYQIQIGSTLGREKIHSNMTRQSKHNKKINNVLSVFF